MRETVKPPRPTLVAYWCPECGRQHNPGAGIPRKLHYRHGAECTGPWQEIVYVLSIPEPPAPKELPTIPNFSGWGSNSRPQFARSTDGGWLILGRDFDIPIGEVVTVHRADGEEVRVRITDHVAQKVINHRKRGPVDRPSTRYVHASFERVNFYPEDVPE